MSKVLIQGSELPEVLWGMIFDYWLRSEIIGDSTRYMFEVFLIEPSEVYEMDSVQEAIELVYKAKEKSK